MLDRKKRGWTDNDIVEALSTVGVTYITRSMLYAHLSKRCGCWAKR